MNLLPACLLEADVHAYVWVLVYLSIGRYETNDLRMGEHLGTHLDAPRHFAEGQWSIAEIPPENLVASAVVVDIRYKAATDPDVTVTVSDIQKWEEENGRIPKGAVVVQCSGWSAFYGKNKTAFWGNDREDTTDFHFPGFGFESVSWLLEHRDIVGIAVDTPSLDCGQCKGFPVHVVAGTYNIYGIENMKDTCLLPSSGAILYVAPMKIAEGSGGPVRLLGVWDDSASRGCAAYIHVNLLMLALDFCVLI